MVKVSFPSIWIPGFKIPKGWLLNITLLGVGLVIPPVDIVFWSAKKILSGFTLFDTGWIVDPIGSVMKGVPKAVWDLCKFTLDSWAADFYKRRREEKE